MASEKTTYWAAVAVLALFLGNHFMNKVDASCLKERAMVAVQELSGSANQFLAMTGVELGKSASPVVQSEAALAQVQGQLASMESVWANQQAACARIQAERAQLMALQQLQGMQFRVICPRQRLRVVIPQSPVRVNDGTI